MNLNKKIIINSLISYVCDKLETINSLIKSSIVSRNNNTKSSAGDKHETSRAKIQLDIDNYQQQKINIINQQKILKSIDLNKSYSKVENGALVETNIGIFFIAIGLGRWIVKNELFFVISLLEGKKIEYFDKRVTDKYMRKLRSIYFNKR